jgi:cytoskeletal protein CcmA (bactofilin family)
MWRKTTEARPQPAASKTPAPAPVTPLATSQTVPQQSSPTTGRPVAATNTTPAAPAAAAPKPVLAEPLVASVPASSTPPPAPSDGTSTISAGLKIKGEITGASDLTIDGETHGKVRIANGRVTVGPNGRVIADIDAREILVFGTVQGNLKATESVRLGASSQVDGSVLTPRIGIDEGASLRGNVEMARPGEASRAQTQSAQASQSQPKQAAEAPQASPSAAPAAQKPEAAKAVSAASVSTGGSADE